MLSLFRNFQLDRLSFWLGFLAASLFWWLIRLLLPALRQGVAALRGQINTARQGWVINTENRLKNEMLRSAQRMHLAAPLFSLDEIIQPPRLLAPPPLIEPGEPAPTPDIITLTLPYTPDWPELAAQFGAATISLVEALEGGCHLVIVGHPGSGKTVALAYLTSLLVRKDPQSGKLAGAVPLLVHASDLIPPEEETGKAIDWLLGGLAPQVSGLTQGRLPALLRILAESGRAILLLDGLDELKSETARQVIEALGKFMQEFPKVRCVATQTPHQIDGLFSLGFRLVALAAWSEEQRIQFVNHWGEQWVQLLRKNAGDLDSTDALLLNTWLLSDRSPTSPLELTMKVWSAYASHVLGPAPTQTIQAYLRIINALLPTSQQVLEPLAARLVLAQETSFTRKEVESWGLQSLQAPQAAPAPGISTGEEVSTRGAPAEQAGLGRVLSLGIEYGLFVNRSENRLAFAHIALEAYLASKWFASTNSLEEFSGLPDEWVGKQLTLYYLAAQNDVSAIANERLARSTEPLHLRLLATARWFRLAPESSSWYPGMMRTLVGLVEDETQAMALRSSVLSAILTSGSTGANAMCRQLMKSPQSSQRRLGALGAGYLRDQKAVQDLIALFEDIDINTRRAACLALVAIGDKEALDALGAALLHSDEDLRRAAAEALANHPEEGYPALREGASLDDILVRRACSFRPELH